MAILYVASEATELKPFADHLTGLRKLKWPLDYAWEGILEGRRILLAANGAGPKLAGDAVEVAIRAAMLAELSSSRLEAVVSTGFCGALDPVLHESQIVVATRVISLTTGEAFECAEISSEGEYIAGPVASQDRVANGSEEKAHLFEAGNVAIEMEAAGIAARAKRAGLPFCCIKVVSDRADESFPFDFNRMRSPEGRIARGKIGVHALTHPKAISSLLRLKRRSESVAKILGEFLVGSRVIANAASLQPES